MASRKGGGDEAPGSRPDRFTQDFELPSTPKHEFLDMKTAAELLKFIKAEISHCHDMIEQVRAPAVEDICAKVLAEVREEMQQMRSAVPEATDVQDSMSALTSMTENLKGKTQQMKNDIFSMSTRRVDWEIMDMRDIESLTKDKEVLEWKSPVFQACGIRGLQLELKAFRNAKQQTWDGEYNDVSLSLCAPEGVVMNMKLFLGSVTHEQCHDFQGTELTSEPAFASLAEQVSDTGTLTLGVEVTEVSRRYGSPNHILMVGSSTLRQEKKAVTGKLVFHQCTRHGNSLSQTETSVEDLRGKTARRFEWCIERANGLKQCFAQGDSLSSENFSVAGIDGFQLVFFPAGFIGARDGRCSYFLFAPEGVACKCLLGVGSRIWEAHLGFGEAGLIGRANFCKLEDIMTPGTDAIVLRCCIEDCVRNLREAFVNRGSDSGTAAPGLAGDGRSQSRTHSTKIPPGFGHDKTGDESETASRPAKVRANLRMQPQESSTTVSGTPSGTSTMKADSSSGSSPFRSFKSEGMGMLTSIPEIHDSSDRQPTGRQPGPSMGSLRSMMAGPSTSWLGDEAS